MKKHNLEEIDRLLASDLASQVSPKSKSESSEESYTGRPE